MFYTGIYTLQKEYANRMANRLPVQYRCLYACKSNRMVQGLLYSGALLVLWCVCYPPARWSSAREANLVTKKHKPNTGERFGEEISKLISGGDVSNTKSALLYLITYEVEVDSNMLHPRVENRIGT